MNLELRPLGRTGLLVSPFSLGTMEFGSKVDQSEAARLFDRAVEVGVIVIDTANVYSGGRSEEIVGQLLRKSATASSSLRNSRYAQTAKTRIPVARLVER